MRTTGRIEGERLFKAMFGLKPKEQPRCEGCGKFTKIDVWVIEEDFMCQCCRDMLAKMPEIS